MKGYGMTDYTDLVAALRLPLHGSQQAWTCGKAADAIVSLAGEVAQLKAASRDIRYTHADQLARVRQAEVKAGRYKNWNDAYQIAITGLRAEEERLRAALRQIAEGTRDGQHCALIASVTLEDKEAVLGGASCHSAEHAMLESTPKGEQRD